MARISTRQIREPQYTTEIEFDASNNPVYVGEAAPGIGTEEPSWRIKRIIYDASGNPLHVLWAMCNTNFDKIWSRRHDYAYG